MPYSSLDELLRERVELMIQTQRDYGWGSQEVRGMKLVAIETTGIELNEDRESTSVSRGATSKVIVGMTVTKEMANTNGTVHGGAVATFADFASSLPIVAIWQDDRWPYSLGVSTNINTHYVAPAQIGQEIEIISWLVHAGRITATFQFEVRAKDTGRLIAFGTHVKQDPAAQPVAKSKL